MAAFYPSGMKNLEADGEPYRPARLLHYFMHDEAETALVVDVTSVWDRRLAAARCFASQFHGGEAAAGGDFPTLIAQPDFLDRLEARARVWGRRAGVTFGEPLVVRGALPLDPAALLV